MKIIAFAGSNSSNSINHKLVKYASSFINDSLVIRLTEYNIPMYSVDSEVNEGFPRGVIDLMKTISSADALIISVAENNRSITAFFKSTLDWLSRLNTKFLQNKKIILLSTSPGGRGGISALETASKLLKFFGGEIIATFSLASFYNNFKEGKIIDNDLNENLISTVKKLTQVDYHRKNYYQLIDG